MKLCGKDGTELRCCKTGMTLHDENFHPDSRHQADLFFCQTCGMVYIERTNKDYFAEDNIPDCTIMHDPEEPILWDVSFVNKIQAGYGFSLC